MVVCQWAFCQVVTQDLSRFQGHSKQVVSEPFTCPSHSQRGLRFTSYLSISLFCTGYCSRAVSHQFPLTISLFLKKCYTEVKICSAGYTCQKSSPVTKGFRFTHLTNCLYLFWVWSYSVVVYNMTQNLTEVFEISHFSWFNVIWHFGSRSSVASKRLSCSC